MIPLVIFSANKLQIEYHYFFLFILTVLSIYSPHYLLFVFIVFLPTNGIIEKEYYLFSLFGLKQLISIFVLFYMWRIKAVQSSIDLKKLINSITMLLVTYAVYNIFTFYKNAYFEIHGFNYFDSTLKALNVLAIILPLIFLVKLVTKPKFHKILLASIIFGVINLFVFTIISPYLPELGLKSEGIELTEFEYMEYSRFVGIIADGDSNTLGTFFVICIGFIILVWKYINKFTVITLVTFSLLGLALTGSRTAFISFLLLLVLYLFSYNRSKIKYHFAFIILIVVVLTLPVWEMIFDRFLLSGQQFILNTESNRIGKWYLYINFILTNPATFLHGTKTELLIGWDVTYYAAHNVYIQVIYNAGLLFLLLFFIAYIKIIFAWNSLKLKKSIWFLLLPYILITNYVSDFGIIYYTTLFLAMVPAMIINERNFIILNKQNEIYKKYHKLSV